MKRYLVIGNPIEHSLSPKLHSYWFKKNNIKAVYEKKRVNESDLKNIILDVKNDKINGINVTKPLKNSVISFLDELTPEANETQSVNTIYKEENKIFGHNTDTSGFELAVRKSNYDVKNKRIFILGAGGVVPSLIFALKKMGAAKIILSNRTKEKAEKFKIYFSYLQIIDWGKIPEFDMIINATSIGLNINDEINLNFNDIGKNKFFYDIIYNPKQTKFLSSAKKLGNKIENGKMMFIYQAHQAFTLWHKIMPDIDEETVKLIEQ